MVSSAFKGAVQNEVSQKTQGINTITGGVKDAATAVLGALGFSGALGSGAVSGAAKHSLANRVGGIGGNIMLASMDEKVADEKEYQLMKDNLFTKEEIGQTIKGTLGDNPINRSATKQLSTVFETLQRAKEQQVMNKQGQIETSFGEVDPTSELGKKILGGLKDDNDR